MIELKYMDDYLDELAEIGLPYCEIIVKRDHETIYRSERGNEGSGKRFCLYSCSKPMTVTAAMRLVEKGLIDIDAPVAEYIPAFKNIRVKTADGGTRPPHSEMLIKHLFTMTAGLNYDTRSENIKLAAARPKHGTFDMVSAFSESPLEFDPGDRFNYSLCHDVLGGVIEAASGMRFDEYMESEIFQPLGMDSTSFTACEEELAPRYVFDAETRVYVPDTAGNTYVLSEGYCSGGAGIISTAEDLSVFCDMLACMGTGANGYKVLNKETVELMTTEQLSKIARDPSFESAGGPGYGYAYGVRTMTDNSRVPYVPLGNFGWDGAAGSYEMCDPENGLSIAFVTNVLGWPAIKAGFNEGIRNALYRSIR